MDRTQHKIAMSSLMSPPEAIPYERFDKASPTPTMARLPTFSTMENHKMRAFSTMEKKMPTFLVPMLSPPVSPETLSVRPDIVDTPHAVVRDPILYPPRDTSPISHPPLFSVPQAPVPVVVERVIAQQIVDKHISDRARRKQLFREASPPERDDYVLALEFKSQVMQMYNADRAKWMSRERQFLLDGQRARNSKKKSDATRSMKTYPTLAPSPSGIHKPTRAPTRTVVRTPKVSRPRSSTTPEAGSGRSRNTGTSTREDKDFASLPDRCPPLGSLPSRPNSLKVEWKGAPLDLSTDAYRHLLHPDEVSLASNLRLDCATYLTSKRRIFLARMECYLGTWNGGKGKKEFRKTDAQQACKIDVNKASKLWMAFERVGWFDEKWCLQWL